MTEKGTQFGILHWGPCVVHTKIQKPILDKLYVAAISSKEKANKELAGVLEEQIHIKDQNQFSDFFNNIFTLYNHALKQWRKDIKEDPKYHLEKLWCNFQKKNEFNPIHIHTNCILSFVHWIRFPKAIIQEGKKDVTTSAGPGGITYHFGEDQPFVLTTREFVPKENTLMIFPSTLKHEVIAFKSDVSRISVAGNIILHYD